MSFPDTVEEATEIVLPDEHGEFGTNLTALLHAAKHRTTFPWSAPAWFRAGDVMLFYLSQRAKPRVIKLFKRILLAAPGKEEFTVEHFDRWCEGLPRDWQQRIDLMNEELRATEMYEATIFAAARARSASSAASRQDERERAKWWKGRVYVELSDVVVFRDPIPIAEFGDFVALSRTAGFTRLESREFQKLVAALSRNSRLPSYLRSVAIEPGGFRLVGPDTWRTIVCGAETPPFMDESQLRTYLADYLLHELRDPRATVHRECRILEPEAGPIADYFVRVEGHWLAVETKLSLRSVADIGGQVRRYCNARRFTPLVGTSRGRQVSVSPVPFCLVIDRTGVYLLDERGFVGCSASRPLVTRQQIGREGIAPLRAKLQRKLAAMA
jgi:hypothetical protein